LLVAVATPYFFLALFSDLVHVFVPLNTVASLFELVNFRGFENGIDAIVSGWGGAGAVTLNRDLVYANQV